MSMYRFVIPLCAVALAAGCSTVPKPLAGEQYREAPLPTQTGEQAVGSQVRWGGTIIETRPQADRTCIEVLAKELDRSASPKLSDEDRGRFIACHDEFIDPEIFVNGREITAVGRIASLDSGRIGEFDYRYPVVDSDAIYLWPDRGLQPFYPYYPYYGSFHYYSGFHHRGFYGGYPYHGFGYGLHTRHRPYYRSGHGGSYRSGGSVVQDSNSSSQ